MEQKANDVIGSSRKSFIKTPGSFLMVFVSMLLLTFVACKAHLKGDNEKFVTSGSADDADPSNGPGAIYSDPARMANDGATSALSDPKNYRLLGGQVIAQPGPKAPAGSKAIALSTNKVTSTFDVTATDTYQYQITTTLNSTLNHASGTVRVVARVIDPTNRPVPGSDFQFVFKLVDKGNKKIGITVNNEPEIQVDNPLPAWQDSDRVGPSQPFTLTKGKYTLLFEVNFDDSAPPDGKADVKGISSVDLK